MSKQDNTNNLEVVADNNLIFMLIMLKYKKVLLVCWVLLALFAMAFVYIYPEFLSKSYFLKVSNGNSVTLTVLYISVVLFRALLFIPSTLVLIPGIILFPDYLVLVGLINWLGILVGGSLIYKLADYIDVTTFFGDKPKIKSQIEKTENFLERFGIWVVMAWSFFPAVPTDLICFVAGSAKMPFYKFLLGLAIGEAVLVALYCGLGEILGWYV